MDILGPIIANFQQNSLLQTFVGVSGAGIFTFLIRDVFLKFLGLIKKEIITELAITNQHQTYHKLLSWIEKNNKDVNFRKLKVTNGVYGHSATILSIGFGNHIIKYNNKFLWVNLAKETGNQTAQDKETITITSLGRDNKVFKDLIKEIKDLDKDTSKLELFNFTDGWSFVRRIFKRDLSTIFIEEDTKNTLINSLTQFINNEEYYLEHGIPYQLGLLLYGPPGTGKSSLIKAIASYINYPIYYLPTGKLMAIQKAAQNLPSKCLLVIEDIDTNSLTHTRAENPNQDEDNIESSIRGLAKVSLSEILNSLDGLIAPHGRILLATTNHVENLDPALIRPGRIDHKIKIDYVSKETLKAFVRKFYNKDIDLSKIEIKENLTVAQLQQMALEKKSLNEIINFCKKETSKLKNSDSLMYNY